MDFFFFFFAKLCLKVGGAGYTQVRLIHESLGYIAWPSSSENPLNEFTTAFPRNPSLLKNVTLKEMMRHLIKFAEKKDVLIWQIIQDFFAGP